MTVARHAGYESRAALGMRPPRSISRNIAPAGGGVALHHGGADSPTSDHASCRRTWLAWQRFHMVDRGWVDIAYTVGVCQHGYVLAGRGAGIRTAANGTNHGNLRYYAVVWIGGAKQTPTVAALEAIAWAVAELRRLGAGMRVVGHTDLKATACPHPRLLMLARELDRTPIGVTPTPPSEEDDVFAVKYGQGTRAEPDPYVRRAQRLLDATAERLGLPRLEQDGVYRGDTAAAVDRVAVRAGLPEDGDKGMHVLVVDYCRNWLSAPER